MLIRLFQILARRFGRRYEYDVRYMEELAAARSSAFVRLAMLTPFTQGSACRPRPTLRPSS
jgi:hypothetical protein